MVGHQIHRDSLQLRFYILHNEVKLWVATDVSDTVGVWIPALTEFEPQPIMERHIEGFWNNVSNDVIEDNLNAYSMHGDNYVGVIHTPAASSLHSRARNGVQVVFTQLGCFRVCQRQNRALKAMYLVQVIKGQIQGEPKCRNTSITIVVFDYAGWSSFPQFTGINCAIWHRSCRFMAGINLQLVRLLDFCIGLFGNLVLVAYMCGIVDDKDFALLRRLQL